MMTRKLKLDMDQLVVESFEAGAPLGQSGTVRAKNAPTDRASCLDMLTKTIITVKWSCDWCGPSGHDDVTVCGSTNCYQNCTGDWIE